MITLGSLFDGAGTVPLAAEMCGIIPVWSSEIEKFPREVTAKRFPNTKQLGDIMKIDGRTIPAVDIIAGGSPCQDVSVAGRRAGIGGERSGLFFEMIRIIKEMRDETSKRADEFVRPRYAVWENVPGAFSSNEGEDFRIVLEEFCKVKDRNAVVPRPAKGGSGILAEPSWEMGIPWLGECSTRVFGEYPNVAEESGLSQILEENVPQKYFLSARACAGVLRRAEKRGKKLPEILETALKQQIERWEKYGTPLPVFDVSVVGVEGIDIYNATTTGKVSKTLNSAATDSDHIPCVVCYDARGNGDGIVAPTITGDHNNRITDYTAICIGRAAFNSGGNTQFSPSVSESGIAQTVTAKGPGAVCYALQGNVVDRNADCNGRGWKKDESYMLNTVDRHSVVYAIGNGQTNQMKLSDEARTLNCMHDQQAVLITLEQAEPVYVVRRLTPLECCRLQGFPDDWAKDIPHSDAQEYRMWGNGMALPNALYIMEGIADAFANAAEKERFDKHAAPTHKFERLISQLPD